MCNNPLIIQVFQRRFNGETDFFRNFSQYEHGFGDINGEFWLGMFLLHVLYAHL